MNVLIKGGTVVNAESSIRADVLTEGGVIRAIGADLQAPAGATTIDAGVNTGRLTPNEFVRVTSTNAAQIFNLYPRKGAIAVSSDADLVVWDPSATKTITTAGSISKVGYNVFEGRKVMGLPMVTLSQGNIVWMNGELRTVRGAGRYINRPAFAPMFDALKRQAAAHVPQAVARV